jgi:hypothetical protein
MAVREATDQMLPTDYRTRRGDNEHQGDELLEDRHAGARAPVPPVYGSGRPAFSPPTVLRGRGRISVHPVSWRPPKRPAAGDKDGVGERSKTDARR